MLRNSYNGIIKKAPTPLHIHYIMFSSGRARAWYTKKFDSKDFSTVSIKN